MRIHEMHASERPRERLWKTGAESLKTSELLAILLRTGMKGKSALAMGEELLQRYGSLDGLCRANAVELARIKGVGMAKAVQLKSAFELASRLASSRRADVPVSTPQDVELLLGDEMRQLPYESLRVISLNTQLKLIAVDEVSRGTVDETVAHPRDVFKTAITRQAHSVMVVHNHPSGEPLPSNADAEFTRQLSQASQLLQIHFLDHIILGTPTVSGAKGYYSFREAGYL